jgi:hypothetical protein
MAYNFQGIGTTFYGKRDFRMDGTYVTTEWIVFLYFPFFPRRSLRVRYQGPTERRFPIGVGYAENYAIFEKTSPNGRQVLYTYAYASFIVAWMLMIIAICASTADATLAFTLLFAGILLPIPIPWILRYYARQTLRI